MKKIFINNIIVFFKYSVFGQGKFITTRQTTKAKEIITMSTTGMKIISFFGDFSRMCFDNSVDKDKNCPPLCI